MHLPGHSSALPGSSQLLVPHCTEAAREGNTRADWGQCGWVMPAPSEGPTTDPAMLLGWLRLCAPQPLSHLLCLLPSSLASAPSQPPTAPSSWKPQGASSLTLPPKSLSQRAHPLHILLPLGGKWHSSSTKSALPSTAEPCLSAHVRDLLLIIPPLSSGSNCPFFAGVCPSALKCT